MKIYLRTLSQELVRIRAAALVVWAVLDPKHETRQATFLLLHMHIYYIYMYIHIQTYIYIYMYMVGPPPCTYPFWRFLVAENCPLRFGCFIWFAKPKQHTAIKDDSPKPAIKDDSPKPKKPKPKKPKKTKPKKTKKTKTPLFQNSPICV